MAQNRRTDDMSIPILIQKIDNLAKVADDRYRVAEERHVESMVWREVVTKEIRSAVAQSKCLADHFIKYKPQLEEGLMRRKWWEKFWEERRQELITYAVKGGAATLFGLAVFALWTKFVAAIQKIFNGTM